MPTEAELMGEVVTETPAEIQAKEKPAEGEYLDEETRAKISQLNARLARLEGSLEKGKDQEGEFQVLSQEELDELIDDDPAEAIRYNAKLIAHKEKQAREARERVQQNKIIDQAEKAVKASVEKIGEIVPGIWDENSEVNRNLTDFAVDNGFDKVYLSVLTNPATRIVPADSEEAYLLGDGAAMMVDLINRFHKAVGRPPGRKGAQATGEGLVGGSGIPKEEREWARLNPEEQRRRLGE